MRCELKAISTGIRRHFVKYPVISISPMRRAQSKEYPNKRGSDIEMGDLLEYGTIEEY